MTNYERTAAWLAACGKQPGDARTVAVQLACVLEEVKELCEAVTPLGDKVLYQEFDHLADTLAGVIEQLNKPNVRLWPSHPDRVEILDAICDIEVTINGLAYLLGMKKAEADERVLASNDAKLVDGKPIILATGKIGKPRGWMPPSLEDLV